MNTSHPTDGARPAPNGASPPTADRVRGLLYGLAVGDSLGNTSEGMLPAVRRRRYGEIRDYLPHHPRGTPSDDTQMAFWTLQHLLEHRTIQPHVLAATFASHRIFGIGSTVRAFCRAYRTNPDAHWRTWGQPSAGNGALMRISPLALVPWITGTTGEELTVMASSLTHNDAASTGSSVAMVTICRELLTETGRPDDPWWWLERWIAVARSVEGATRYSPRGGAFRTWSGSLWQFLDTHVRDAFRAGLSTVEACNRWYSGAYLLETVPSVLYILMRHAHDPVEAIVRAVNDTRDNDTIAAIVGTVVGAAYGAAALPARWVDNLTGRVHHDDDGTVQRLTEMAVARVCD